MPIGVKKPSFFRNSLNLGEPISLRHESFLSLDTSAYLGDLTESGNLFTQFLNEAQRFDFRYSIEFDAQYAYAYTGQVSGRVVTFPNGANPADYVVDIFVYTDQAYYIETVPVGSDWTWTTIAGTNKGNKIAHLAAVENVIETGGGGEVVSFGTVLAETYVTNPQEGRRLPRSYNVDPNHSAFEQLRYRSFSYDCAATIVALVSLGEQDKAADYCLSLLKTQQRLQQDDGGNATNQTNTDRMPFSSFLHNPQFLIDAYHRTGAEMWVANALLHFANVYSGDSDASTIKSRAFDLLVALYNQEFVLSEGLQDGLFRGGKGSYTTDLDEENNQLVYLSFDPDYSVAWCANEHNVDAYFTLKLCNSLSLTKNLNALLKSGTAGFTTAGVDSALTGDFCLQGVVCNSDFNIGMSETASGTALTSVQISTDGVLVNYRATGEIHIHEDGVDVATISNTYTKGDVITLEHLSSGAYKVYQNGNLIHTATYTNTNAQNIHFMLYNDESRMDKLQLWADTLENYSYDRTYPIRSFDNKHSNLTQDIIDELRASVQAGLSSSSVFYDATEERGRRGVSDDSTLDTAHALDNMTWYSIALRDMGLTDEADACIDFITNGEDGTYSTYDGFYSAIGVVPYIPNNGAYSTPVATALMWTEGHAGYVMALRAAGNTNDAIDQWKEIAKISRIDGIPYVTRADNVYELQDWGCLIAAAWSQIANKPAGFWEQSYDQLVT